MATSPGQLDETRQRAREVTDDLRQRYDELEPLVRERWSELEPVVRERWSELEPVVRERLEDLEPAARQAQISLWRGLRVLFSGLAVLPAVLVRVLKALAGTADEVTERGVQASEDVRKRRRSGRGIRLRRRTLAAYVVGGLGVGFAAGWTLGRRGTADEDWHVDEAPAPLGAAVDQRSSPGATPGE